MWPPAAETAATALAAAAAAKDAIMFWEEFLPPPLPRCVLCRRVQRLEERLVRATKVFGSKRKLRPCTTLGPGNATACLCKHGRHVPMLHMLLARLPVFCCHLQRSRQAEG